MCNPIKTVREITLLIIHVNQIQIVYGTCKYEKTETKKAKSNIKTKIVIWITQKS